MAASSSITQLYRSPQRQRNYNGNLSMFIALTTLTVFIYFICTVETTKHDELLERLEPVDDRSNYEFEFVPLADQVEVEVRVRRQTSNGNILNTGKSRPSVVSTKTAQKVDKNSASNPADVGQTKNLSSAPDDGTTGNGSSDSEEEKGDYDDQLIKELLGNEDPADNQTIEKPKIHHDHHLYYNSTIVMEPQRIDEYWVDLDKIGNKVVIHDMLSKSYRRAATVSLSFEFPFYGHMLKNATIATGGFLYLGDYMHSWLASTQYIAPLMANFDTRMNTESVIKYADNGTDFVVQWEETALQDLPSVGTFTFQARLRNTGDIIFAYSKIPVQVSSIPDTEHPVRIGVSDAYIIDRAMLFHTRKIIYEYHRVEIKKENITNLTAVYLTALPSCITMKDCESCINNDIQFECSWCVPAQRCSDGMDRYRHEWLYKGCDSASQLHDPICPAPDQATSMAKISKVLAPDGTDPLASTTEIPTDPTVIPSNVVNVSPTVSVTDHDHNSNPNNQIVDVTSSTTLTENEVHQMDGQRMPAAAVAHKRRYQENSSLGAIGVIGILFTVTLIAGLIVWVTYAYKYPHSSSGQIIIRYRPSRWHWLKGEDDYTPASVHI